MGDDDETAITAGAGLRYYLTKNLSLSLQSDLWSWEEDSGNDFSVVSTAFGISYIF